MEILRFIFYSKKCQKERKFEKNQIKREDEFTSAKICELYGLIYFKTNIIYLKNNRNFKDLINFINYKYNWHKKYFTARYSPQITQDDYAEVISYKKNLIKKNEENADKEVIKFRNLDSTFSPFLLDRYAIPFYSKLVLSPYYS